MAPFYLKQKKAGGKQVKTKKKKVAKPNMK